MSAPARHPLVRISTAWGVLAMLAGCAPGPATAALPLETFALGAEAPPPPSPASTPVAAAAIGVLAKRITPGARPTPAASAPAPTPVATAVAPASGGGGSGGGGAAAPLATPVPSSDPNAPRLVLADGRTLTLAGSDEVALPAGLAGLVSLFEPGRVPSSLELPADGVGALHPQALANPAEPTGQATIEGSVTPAAAGLRVAYHAPGRQAFVGGLTDDQGRFRLEVPLDGEEAGVLLALDGQATPRLALAGVTLEAGVTTSAPALALADPTARAAPPALPAAWQWQGATLAAVPDAAPRPWRVPVLVADGPEGLPGYDTPGFALVGAYAAESADASQGGLVSGPAGALPDWLGAPDPSGLPASLAPGTALSWPAVPGAKLYTLRLSSPSEPRPVWEAACVKPTLVVPSGLALDRGGLVLELTAWDAPDVSVYSVAGLRALRLPVGPSGPAGRLSWARRAIGPASK
jgi:hypothetical protein